MSRTIFIKTTDLLKKYERLLEEIKASITLAGGEMDIETIKNLTVSNLCEILVCNDIKAVFRPSPELITKQLEE